MMHDSIFSDLDDYPSSVHENHTYKHLFAQKNINNTEVRVVHAYLYIYISANGELGSQAIYAYL